MMGVATDLRVSAYLAWRTIRRGNRGTTVMTIGVLAIVFVNMLFMPALIDGFGQAYNQKFIDYYSGHVILLPREGDQFIEEASALMTKVSAMPGVLGVTKRESTGVIVSYRDRVLSKGLIAVDPVDEGTVSLLPGAVVDGEFLDEAEGDRVLLGYYLAGQKDATLELYESLRGAEVGETVRVTFNNGVVKDYRIGGIVRSKDDLIDNAIFITTGELDRVLGQDDRATEVLVRLAPSVSPDQFKYDLLSLGIQHQVKTWYEQAAVVREVLKSYDIIKVISTAAGIMIAVIVIFVVVYINTVNRRRQIGILKAIGIGEQVIINAYLIQVAFLSVLGLAFGFAAVLGLIALLTRYPIAFPNVDVTPHLVAGTVAMNAVMLLAASVAAGYVPAWMTARHEILEAIRG